MSKAFVSSLFIKSLTTRKLGEAISNSQKMTIISGLVGSSYPLVIAEVFKQTEKPFLIVLNNKEEWQIKLKNAIEDKKYIIEIGYIYIS